MSLTTNLILDPLRRVAAGAALGVAIFGLWQAREAAISAQIGSPRAALARPVFHADKINDIQTSAKGDYFIWRDGGMERYLPDGRIDWPMTPIEDAPGVRPFDAYAMAPTPEGDLLVLGTARDPSRDMVLYRIAGRRPQISQVGVYPGMAAGDLTVTPKGVVYLLSVRVPEINAALFETRSEVLRAEWLHELAAGGEINRSLLTREYSFHSSEDASRAIEEFHDSRVVSSADGTLYVYNQQDTWLERIDPVSGASTGRTHLQVVGFPLRTKLSHVQFMSNRELVYSLYEVDPFGGVCGYQSHQIDLETGMSRLLERKLQPDGVAEVLEAHHNPRTDQFLFFDLVGTGSQPARTLARSRLSGNLDRQRR